MKGRRRAGRHPRRRPLEAALRRPLRRHRTNVRLNDEPHVIVGVMPPGIDYPDRATVWTPGHWRVPDDSLAPAVDPTPQRDHSYLVVLARVKPEITLAQASTDMVNVALGLERDYPDANVDSSASLLRLREDLVGDVRPTILLLFAAVGILLLIATVNVAGLLVARATRGTRRWRSAWRSARRARALPLSC